ncbi:MAG: hypothetical protein NUW06_02510 [Candidatus Acetothermia bacterium]|jgi:hypothetical protein|nr:hypothetical protein [Candidatus Acetothermia bacterium]MDH7504561.1 hypothetical protein [Candidatus Acetothermia bacterium]
MGDRAVKRAKWLLAVAPVVALLLVLVLQSGSKGGSSPADILAVDGHVTYLRIHDVGTGYGPSNDFLDVEVVVALDSTPNQRFGFQLRPDANQLVHQGMLDLLQQAFQYNYMVRLEFYQEPGRSNSVLFRVMTWK